MKKSKSKIWIVLLIVLLLLILFCIAYIIYRTSSIEKENQEYKNLASSVATRIENTEMTSPSIDVELADNPVDFAALQNQNDEIYAWIYIPDTNVNYPICQSKTDDNFYLEHDIYGNYSFAGTIYSQSCNNTNFTDRVTLLYGHNMADGSMFADIHKFSDSDFFDKHRYFYIYTSGHKLKYEVVSAYIYDDRHIMNSFDFSKDEVFTEYLDYITNPRSLTKSVRDGVSLDIDDKVVTLSTCLNSGEGRYLVQGVLTEDELTK